MEHESAFEVLGDGAVVLGVGDHCIETAVRRARARLVDVLLGDEPAGPEIQDAVETLTRFLEATDFARLRSEHPELSGGTHRVRVRLSRTPAGPVRWEVLPPDQTHATSTRVVPIPSAEHGSFRSRQIP